MSASQMFFAMEPFDASTMQWDRWISRYEEYVLCNPAMMKTAQEDDTQHNRRYVATFLMAIGPTAFQVLENLTAPDKPKDRKLDDLAKLLRDHYQPAKTEIAERFKFNQRRQNNSESATQYLAELRRLATTCNFGASLDDYLRDRFVCGLRTDAVQKRLLAETDLKLTKALEVALAMEAAERSTRELHGNNSGNVNQVRQSFKKQPFNRSGGSSSSFHNSNNAWKGGKSSPQQQRPGGHKFLNSPSFPTATQPSKSPCPRCGKPHWLRDCRYPATIVCNKCSRQGHIAATHRGGQPKPRNSATHNVDSEDFGMSNLWVDSVQIGSATGINYNTPPPATVDVSVNGQPIAFEIDTGSGVTLIGKTVWQKSLNAMPLQPSPISLTAYSGHQLPVLGQAIVTAEVNGQSKQVPLFVVDGHGKALFGRNWLCEFKLDWPSIKQKLRAQRPAVNNVAPTDLGKLISQYKDSVFAPGLGKMANIKAHISMKPDFRPKFFKARSLAFALKSKVEATLDRHVKQGVLEPIPFADNATPTVPILKKDGDVRVCGDFKVTLNPDMLVDKYPLPKAEELFASFQNGQQFSNIDLAEAFLQMELDDESKQLAVINTHKGLYRYNRLPFGVSCAPAQFQKAMDTVLQGLPGIVWFQDDIGVTGSSLSDHLGNLAKLFERLKQYGLRVNLSKCKFLQPSIKFLGHIIDKHGIHPLMDKTKAISAMPVPANPKQMRSFMGKVQYYAKFIPQLSTVAEPLHKLTRDNVPWIWSKDCDDSFRKVKQLLTSSTVLVHFNPALPLGLATDASSYGLGAVLFHYMPDGSERPIAYASRTMSPAQRNYAQIEKEALSIIFGLQKFQQYLFGNHFTLVTDHKPLLAIFGQNRSLPAMATSRLQRWAWQLQSHNYSIQYKQTDHHGNADGLSRLPLPETAKESSDEAEIAAIEALQLDSLPVTAEQIRKATAVDPVLSQALQFVRNGWPSTGAIPAMLQQFAVRQSEISISNDCLLWGLRVIVPASLRQAVLQELHVAHPGIVRMKALARRHCWWPGMDSDIETIVKACHSCNEHRKAPEQAPLHPWEFPSRPWQRIHIDFAGPFQGKMWFVVVDARSKWPEIVLMQKTTTTSTIAALRSIFARQGLAAQIVSDNGPQFASDEFATFCKNNGISHIFSAPYHPRTNGAAERMVQSLKSAMKSMADQGGDIQQRLDLFLMSYRNTPHTTTNQSPAEMLMGRRLRTRLDLLQPSAAIDQHVEAKQRQQVDQHGQHNRLRKFNIGQHVWARDFRSNAATKWHSAVVISQTGPVSYQVEVDGQLWRRHVDQLLARESSAIPHSLDPPDIAVPQATPPVQPQQALPPAEPPNVRPQPPAEQREQPRPPLRAAEDQPHPPTPAAAPRQTPRRNNIQPPPLNITERPPKRQAALKPPGFDYSKS